jgi:hypothetical protein
MFNPSKDLTVIQNILKADNTILTLLELTGTSLTNKVNAYIAKHPGTSQATATNIIITNTIIRESRWNNLVGNERRLCFYFVPSRKTRNESFNSEVVEFDCHVPAGYGFYAYQVHEQIYKLLQKQKVNNRYLYFEGQLGELPTMSGFFCCGSRFTFNRKI